MFEAKTNTIFETANKIRAAWVNQVRDTLLDVKLKSHPREVRFAVYAEIDNDIRKEYIRLLQERAEQMKAEGNCGDKAIIGRRILKKEHQIDTDNFLYQAVNTVVDQINSEMDFYREPEAIAA